MGVPSAFDAHTLVILRRPIDAPTFSEEELERLQAGHLAFLDGMHGQRHAVASGPFGEQDEISYRGLSIYRTSIEETRRLLRADPMIQARRLEAILVTWYVAAGSLAFPLARDR